MGKSSKQKSRGYDGDSKSSDLRKRLRRLEKLLEKQERSSNAFHADSRRSRSRSRHNLDRHRRRFCAPKSISRSRSPLTSNASLSNSPEPSSRSPHTIRTSLSPQTMDRETPPVLVQEQSSAGRRESTEALDDGNVLLLEDSSSFLDDLGEMLGNDGPTKPTQGENIHEAIASRWNHILVNGLPKDTLEALSLQHSIPGNCPLLTPPKLNPEIVSILANDRSARDNFNKDVQLKISLALSAMGKSMSLLLNDSSNITKEIRDVILTPLGDASHLLTHAFFVVSDSRRKLVLPTLNKSMKDILENTSPGEFLFGSNISESVREAKSLQSTGKELKALPSSFSFTPRGGTGRGAAQRRTRPGHSTGKENSLNYYGPTRRKGLTKSVRGRYNQSQSRQGKYRR